MGKTRQRTVDFGELAKSRTVTEATYVINGEAGSGVGYGVHSTARGAGSCGIAHVFINDSRVCSCGELELKSCDCPTCGVAHTFTVKK